MQSRCIRTLLTAAVVFALGLPSLLAQQPAAPAAPAAILVTKRMCCAHEGGPAVKEMSKIPGIASVVPDYKTRSLVIVAKGNAAPSPLAIWEAAERTKLEPIRLSTTQGVYNSKPRR